MVYQVIMEDEYHNLHHLGFYRELKDSLKDINQWLGIYDTSLEEDDLIIHSSTFDFCFDRGILVDDCVYVYLRGFVFDELELEKGE